MELTPNEIKLTAAQIDHLFIFTRQHYVEWYDLQSELVDHLANAIESRWKENPKQSFDEALNLEFRKFGVFGFMDVVEKRQKILNRKYNLLVWKHFKEFFKLPKIILTIAAVYIVFYILEQFQDKREIFRILLYGIIIVLCSILFIRKKNRENRRQQTDKRWLFEEIINNYGNLAMFMMFPIQFMNLYYNSSSALFQNQFLVLCASVVIVAYSVTAYIVLMYIPSKAREYLRQTYPEYKFYEV